MTPLHALGFGLLLAMAAPAYSQDKAAPKAAPAAAPAAVMPAASAVAPAAAKPAAAAAVSAPAAAKPAAVPDVPLVADKADAPKKKRVAVKRKPKNTCTQLDDPWDNVCDIQKKAQLACNDLPTGKKAAKKPPKGQVPMTTENRRQQCVDNYMRNV